MLWLGWFRSESAHVPQLWSETSEQLGFSWIPYYFILKKIKINNFKIPMDHSQGLVKDRFFFSPERERLTALVSVATAVTTNMRLKEMMNSKAKAWP